MLHLFAFDGEVVRVGDVGDGLALQFVKRIADDVAQRLVGAQHAAIGGDHADSRCRLIEGRTKATFAGASRRFAALEYFHRAAKPPAEQRDGDHHDLVVQSLVVQVEQRDQQHQSAVKQRHRQQAAALTAAQRHGG